MRSSYVHRKGLAGWDEVLNTIQDIEKVTQAVDGTVSNVGGIWGGTSRPATAVSYSPNYTPAQTHQESKTRWVLPVVIAGGMLGAGGLMALAMN